MDDFAFGEREISEMRNMISEAKTVEDIKEALLNIINMFPTKTSHW